MAEDSCPTNLLEDIPTQKDDFGSHERVAKAIFNLIKSEKGGKSIALTGTWGSGKSSVIKMLKESCKEEIEVFTFNSWSHEGDPLRRTFLEELIDFLKEEWIEKEFWQKKKRELSSKSKEVTKEKTPILTCRGKIFAILSLLVPAGIGILSAFNGFLNFNLTATIIGLILTIAPVLFVLGLIIFEKEGKNSEESNEKKELLNFLSQQSNITTETESIETPEPTSVEFQQYFSDLLREALSTSKKKLVIVIDNLDRIAPEEALKIWATMRMFFNFDLKEDWRENFWLLVPFDEKAVKKLWEDRTNYKKDHNGLSNAFLEKTFQIKFHVSPPLLSNWKDFFINQLQKALPKHSKKEFHKLYRIFAFKRRNSTIAPTPRQIKLYINKIGALHRQWQDKIPLQYMALFTSLEEVNWENKEPKEVIIKSNFLDQELIKIVGNEWQQWLAALYLNKPKEEAMQVLLYPKINHIISEKDVDLLLELQEINGFYVVLEDYIERSYSLDKSKGNEQSDIPMLAFMLGNFSSEENTSWNRVWELMSDFIIKMDFLNKINSDIGTGICYLLKYKKETKDSVKYFKKIIKILSNSKLDVNEGEETNKEEIKNWLEGIAPILKTVLDHKQGEKICSDFNVPGREDEYIKILSMLKEKKNFSNLYKFFTPKINMDKIIDEISRYCETKKYKLSDFAAVEVIKEMNLQINWNSVIDKIYNSLKDTSNKNLNLENIQAMMLTMLSFKRKNKTKNHLKNLIRQGFLTHHLHTVKRNSKVVSIIMLTILEHYPQLNNINDSRGNSSQGLIYINSIINNPNNLNGNKEQVLDCYLEIMNEYSSIENLIKLVNKNSKFKSFVVVLIKKIINNNKFDCSISSETFKEKFELFDQNFNKKECEKIIRQLVVKFDELIDFLLKEFDVTDASLYLLMMKLIDEKKTKNNFIDFVISGLEGVELETWESQLKHSGDLICLLVKVREEDYNLNMGHALSDALENHCDLLIKDEFDLPVSENKWDLIISSLEDSIKSTFLKRIRTKIIKNAKNTIDSVLKLYGDHLNNWKVLKGRIDDIISILFREILKRKNKIETKWMIEVIKNNEENLVFEGLDSLSDLQSRLKSILESEELPYEDEIKDDLSNIYNILKQVDISHKQSAVVNKDFNEEI